MTGTSPRFRLAVAALCLALCGACRLDTTVGIEVAADGRGEVRVTAVLDKDAARLVGDVRERVRTGDLLEAGWEVGPPETRADGSVVVVARHPFVGNDGAGDALADLGGDGGPFKGFRLRQERTFWKTTTTFSGDVDLGHGIDAFADAELLERLGGGGPGRALGVPIEQLERRFGERLAALFDLEVAVELPGRVTSDARVARDGREVWPLELGDATSLSASAEQWNVRNLALAAAALACGLAAAAVFAWGRRARSPEPGPEPQPEPGA